LAGDTARKAETREFAGDVVTFFAATFIVSWTAGWLAAVWACWHLPLFIIPGTDTTGQSFPVYLLTVMALSVAMAWLYWRTDGSLLMTMLMHAAINNTKDIVPSTPSTAGNIWAVEASVVGWAALAVLWICAAYFLVQMRRGRLHGGPEHSGGGSRVEICAT
jgi:membrane protease YdiL (CAAX protease family)